MREELKSWSRCAFLIITVIFETEIVYFWKVVILLRPKSNVLTLLVNFQLQDQANFWYQTHFLLLVRLLFSWTLFDDRGAIFWSRCAFAFSRSSFSWSTKLPIVIFWPFKSGALFKLKIKVKDFWDLGRFFIFSRDNPLLKIKNHNSSKITITLSYTPPPLLLNYSLTNSLTE